MPYSQILRVKRSGPEPLYYQLAQSLETAVAAGTIQSGTKLLSVAEMARELHLTASTVRRAWSYLERKGVLGSKPDAGTTIL